MKEPLLFEFTGADSLSQLGILLWLIIGSGIVIPMLLGFGQIQSLFCLACVGLLILPGLRSTIVVTPNRATVTRKWFRIPYRQYSAQGIDDVWFGGDWGLEDGAMGVVVKLGGKEVHIGSSKTMHHLHNSLLPLSVKFGAQQGTQHGRAENGGPVS